MRERKTREEMNEIVSQKHYHYQSSTHCISMHIRRYEIMTKMQISYVC